jgi:hypothetical protein
LVNWRLAAALFLLTCSAACADRARVNSTCKWISHPHANLDDDALFAEDLAIRYADVHRGHRSGHYKGVAEYQQAREQCMTQLFDAVARDHHVTPAQVREALTHRPLLLDAGATAFFFMVYGLAAAAAAGWIFRRFSIQHAWAAALATLVASVPVSIAGWISGGLWTAAVDIIRIGNDHASYRSARVPWSQHQPAAFAACVVVFWLVAAVRARRA